MFSKNLERFKTVSRTAGFRLGAWQFAVFMAGTLGVLGLAYLMLSLQLQNKDRQTILAELRELSAAYREEGLPGLREKVRQDKPPGGEWFFVRLARDGGSPEIISAIKGPAAFDLSGLGRPAEPAATRWDLLPAPGEEDELEAASELLPDGAVLSVGAATSEREEFLEDFRAVSLGILAAAALFGFFGSVFLTRRALRPLQHLVETVRAIEAGDLAARAPTRGTGDELDEAAGLFNRMLDRISALVRGMREALDSVAHDLRTPLTRLRASGETALLHGRGEKDCREALSDSLEESEKVLSLLNAIMDVSEAETGTMKLKPEPVDLAAALAETAELYQYAAEAKDISISVAAEPGLEALACDRARLRQLLGNLADNAVKYTPRGGAVALSAGRVSGEIFIRVKDTGPGIPAKDLPRIWDRLYRADASRSEKGLGLGLSLVKAVMQAHGGRAEAVSPPGGGAEFTLYFPAQRQL